MCCFCLVVLKHVLRGCVLLFLGVVYVCACVGLSSVLFWFALLFVVICVCEFACVVCVLLLLLVVCLICWFASLYL